jgi:4,5-DOPA dioxygenase extradiol
MTQPSLFISHGAPDLALSDAPARHFLARLGAELPPPDAIVIASAHDEAEGVVVRAPARFRTWHDFGNFDPRLFEMRYEPQGAPRVAAETMDLLGAAGLTPRQGAVARIDHGAWVPLSLLFPAANVPVVSVSIDPRRDAGWHESVGRALAPLRDRNVLVVGSGSITHNLRAVFAGSAGQDRGWAEGFTTWLEEAIRDGDRERLLAAMRDAPEAARNHPTDEHLLPLFVAAGAGGSVGRRLHHSWTYDVLAMDAYAFGEAGVVAALEEALAEPAAA